MTPISKRQRAHLYIYNHRKKRNIYIYIYKNPDTLQKARKFALRIYSQKIQTLYITRFFMEFLNLVFIYIQKAWYFALCDIFINKKPDTPNKQDNFCYFLKYKKPDTIHYAIFMKCLRLADGGGVDFYMQKTMHFALSFYMQKAINFPLRFYIQKSRHIASHFKCKKQCTLRYVFFYVKFIV